MRALVLVVLATACTVGDQRDPLYPTPAADPDRMPSAVLAHQDPGADTSHNPVLTRSGGEYTLPPQLEGCLRLIACSAGPGSDASGVLVALAVVGAVRRRRRQS